METKKLSICLFLLGITLMGVVNAQKITMPLKKNSKGQLIVSVKYGAKQCEVNLQPQTSECSNVITEEDLNGSCGASYIGDNTQIYGKIFFTKFQLGDVETPLLYSIPKPNSLSMGYNTLCFSNNSTDITNNAFQELAIEKQIANKTVYYYIHSHSTVSNDENALVGTLSIGGPNLNLSQGNFVPLMRGNYDTIREYFQAKGAPKFRSFGLEFDSSVNVIVQTTYTYINIPSKAFYAFADALNARGIHVTIQEYNYSYNAYVQSIDQFEDLHFDLFREDGSIFEIVLTPAQYTRRLADDTFEIMFNPIPYESPLAFPLALLDTYNVGFDLDNQRILIEKKASAQQAQNFRGAQIKL